MKDFAKGFRSWTVIDLDNYSYNVNQFREIIDPGTDIMQIVKADAYGHGSVEIAREAENLGIKWLGVANSDEGVLLRLENISAKILILSPSLISEIDDIIKYNLIPSVSRFDFIEKLDKYLGKMNKRIPVHINFDTGMGRAGFLWKDAPEVLTKINEYDNIFVQGAFSHFSQSEEADDKFTKTQYKRFEKIKDAIKSAKLRPKYYHISNSAAVVNYPQYSMDMVRLGLASYGVYTDKNLKEKINLKPVLKFCSKISLIKEVPANYSISYNRTFVTKKPTKFALVPIGYGDGYNYLLSNKGKVIIKNSYCPIIGKVTMDMLVVDVSELPEVQVGDEVLLLGESGTKSVRAEELADRYDGLSYELLCALGRRAKRVYIKKEKQEKIEPISRRKFVVNDFSNYKLEKIIQTSLKRRLNSNEIGGILYKELIKNLFSSQDDGLLWKKDMQHSIKFYEIDDPSLRNFYKVKTTLNYRKRLNHTRFTIACATNMKNLERYFLSERVEYRWLLDSTVDLKNSFKVDKVKINDIVLDKRLIENGNKENLEIECYHQDGLNDLLGKEVEFSIDTTTYYPRYKHQLTVYLSDLTKSIHIEFDYSDVDIEDVEIVSIFAGKEKYPVEKKVNGKIIIKSSLDEWYFPHSGVVFVW